MAVIAAQAPFSSSSELDGPAQRASAAQRALAIFEIVDLIVRHVECHNCNGPSWECKEKWNGCRRQPRPLLDVSHVNRVWRAATQPILLRDLTVRESAKSDERDSVSWCNRLVSLDVLFRDIERLLHHTISLQYKSPDSRPEPDHLAYAFEVLARCINLRHLSICDSYTRTWSRLAGKPLLSLPYLQRLDLRCDITQLTIVGIDIASLSYLKDIELDLWTEAVDGRC